jgi:hypothetical protein
LSPNYNFHFNGIKRNALNNAIVNFVSWTICLPYSHNTFSSFDNFLAHIVYHLPTHPIRPMFHGNVKTIQLYKQFFHCHVSCHGVAMIKQMKNQSELNNFFLLLNLIYTMNDLLQHYFRNLSKMELLIGNMDVVLQEIIFFPYLLCSNMVTKALWQLVGFHNKLSLGAKYLSPPSI